MHNSRPLVPIILTTHALLVGEESEAERVSRLRGA